MKFYVVTDGRGKLKSRSVFTNKREAASRARKARGLVVVLSGDKPRTPTVIEAVERFGGRGLRRRIKRIEAIFSQPSFMAGVKWREADGS